MSMHMILYGMRIVAMGSMKKGILGRRQISDGLRSMSCEKSYTNFILYQRVIQI